MTRGNKTGICIFCIPVGSELDLKTAAKLAMNKVLEFVKVTELNLLTGYGKGGCSPIGMKKTYYEINTSTANVN